MGEVICDSKTFTVKLATEVVFRFDIFSHTEEAKEGESIRADLRIFNTGNYPIEVQAYLSDSLGEIEKEPDLQWENIDAGHYVDITLNTFGLSRDMPAHDWNLTAKVCARPKGLL